ncbi:MAG TPA: sugar ABC transporter permease [Povalibacter sp.]|nr:sugar ABC transporter permease [Povalibacter sp.]
MASIRNRATAQLALSPAVILLLVWMAVPLAMTLWYSFHDYQLLMPRGNPFIGFENYVYFLTDPAFLKSIVNTFVLVGSVLVITVAGGIGLALLLDQPMYGRGIVRVLIVSPFFVMPTVSALVWKNMFMNPVNGLFAWLAQVFGVDAIDWLAQVPLLSLTLIVAWGWLPFATLILLTSLQSLDTEQQEAAAMDGAGAAARFVHITLPHLARAITVVILIQTIFLLSLFAEIFVTTNGGPGTESTNLAYLVYSQALLRFDVGSASAGGVVAVILANVLAVFLMRLVGRNLEV